jgi:hypothetical protein
MRQRPSRTPSIEHGRQRARRREVEFKRRSTMTIAIAGTPFGVSSTMPSSTTRRQNCLGPAPARSNTGRQQHPCEQPVSPRLGNSGEAIARQRSYSSDIRRENCLAAIGRMPNSPPGDRRAGIRGRADASSVLQSHSLRPSPTSPPSPPTSTSLRHEVRRPPRARCSRPVRLGPL